MLYTFLGTVNDSRLEFAKQLYGIYLIFFGSVTDLIPEL